MLNINGSPSAASVTLQTLDPTSETVAEGYYAATTLSAVDGDLATANILSGKTIFGKAGAATVREIGAADALVTDVKDPKTFFSVTGAIKTGTMQTVALDPALGTYLAGYHAGNAGGLVAVEAQLVTGNIRAGINIFGVDGKAEVVDTTEGADAADNTMIALGKKAWVNGVEITGIHV
jgi:hypothetical protein